MIILGTYILAAAVVIGWFIAAALEEVAKALLEIARKMK
jgi:hypothetical protein